MGWQSLGRHQRLERPRIVLATERWCPKRCDPRRLLHLPRGHANDGVLRAWIDGQPVYENTGIRFRDVDSLHVERAWFDIYYGGTWTAPDDMYIDFDNAVVAFEKIEPYDPNPPSGSGGGNSGGSAATGGASSATGGGNGSDGGSGLGGSGADGSSNGIDSSDADEGCGCRAAGGAFGSRDAPFAFAALLALALRRRKRQLARSSRLPSVGRSARPEIGRELLVSRLG